MLIEPRPLDDPDVLALIGEVQLEYVRRYGGPDDTGLLPHEFRPPRGVFLLALTDGIPGGIGGWRAPEPSHRGLRDGDAEIKRMYVRANARRRGVAERVLGALERTATDAGRRRMVLETGSEQPEAIALYAKAGYVPMTERFGLYAHSPTAMYYYKDLPPIRLATDDDLPVLQEIERAAGKPFAEIGMTFVADDDPPSVEDLRVHRDAGRCWVWFDGDGLPVAYLAADIVDDGVHIEQVSVHPDHARRGIGRMLIEHAAGWARDAGFGSLSLTTYRDVPWNGPYYARLGFRTVADDALSPALARIRAEERKHGLDRWPRIVMRREVEA
ncbi:GNAT family N-acetyltransferase [Rhodococcus gordoniae]|uniref:GNAT family N-acetyltransferase n=1 Tax=Rhodococcus gordoniae TaxID=223392 RepID=UPI0020CBE146|nr:GNAT family N-acetyltransferase [Rhodococcus gordoniae]UTT47647.1 GNAT family N-acetyltransferase [Rhodococcus gordoniae]